MSNHNACNITRRTQTGSSQVCTCRRKRLGKYVCPNKKGPNRRFPVLFTDRNFRIAVKNEI